LLYIRSKAEIKSSGGQKPRKPKLKIRKPISHFNPPHLNPLPPRGRGGQAWTNRSTPTLCFSGWKIKGISKDYQIFSLSPLGERAGVRGKLGIFSSIREVLKQVRDKNYRKP
jgi:hypothetical protein